MAAPDRSPLRYPLRPVGLEFVDVAPVRYVVEAPLTAPVRAVWDAISADPSTWTWWRGLRDAGYFGVAPPGVGTTRQVTLAGTTYRETMLVWDAPTRWAYRVDECSVPIAHALVETWDIVAHGGGSVLRWTFAADPRFGLRVAGPLRGPIIARVFRTAMRRLDRHLQHVGAGSLVAPAPDA